MRLIKYKHKKIIPITKAKAKKPVIRSRIISAAPRFKNSAWATCKPKEITKNNKKNNRFILIDLNV
ncbi:hypothetical protein GCM10007422_30520 [Pedobacter zeae]|uniref:Uncharacterized protein n=1 Tax=Pedobacter zeae TaxID=1737356 RepID=A0ABQ1Y3S9_9SPHI|nr:hypothetical protein GCM10007422_30520 [Pedobacter zeae]